jgi:hypothetical protein
MNITFDGDIPDKHMEEFLTFIRDFNDRHPDVQLRVGAMAGAMDTRATMEMLERIGFPVLYVAMPDEPGTKQ